MPKIKKSGITINFGDRGRWVDYDIMFSNGKFYSTIPASLESAFRLLTTEQRQNLHASEIKKGKYGDRGLIGFGVRADTLEDVEHRMVTLLKTLLGISIKKRPVIIVKYQGNVEKTNLHTFPDTEVSLSLTYAIESSVSGGESGFVLNNNNKPGFEQRVEMGYRWRDDTIILDDTPNNRAFLEQLHGALNKLREKLDVIMSDNKSLLRAIDNKTKLLQ